MPDRTQAERIRGLKELCIELSGDERSELETRARRQKASRDDAIRARSRWEIADPGIGSHSAVAAHAPWASRATHPRRQTTWELLGTLHRTADQAWILSLRQGSASCNRCIHRRPKF